MHGIMREKSFYFDVSIWLDIYEKRGYNGEAAKFLLKNIIEEDCSVLYSDLLIAELKRVGYTKEEIRVLLGIVKAENLKRVHIYPEEIKEATTIAVKRTVPKADALHAILARDNAAQLISRDWDFTKLKDITKAKLPEDIK